jgi:hypothetical protein
MVELRVSTNRWSLWRDMKWIQQHRSVKMSLVWRSFDNLRYVQALFGWLIKATDRKEFTSKKTVESHKWRHPHNPLEFSSGNQYGGPTLQKLSRVEQRNNWSYFSYLQIVEMKCSSEHITTDLCSGIRTDEPIKFIFVTSSSKCTNTDQSGVPKTWNIR